jgi:cystathionine gamma-lyase
VGREKEKAMREDRLALTHVGEHQSDYLNAVTPPVFLNSLHIFEDMDGYLNNGKTGAYVYGRVANPTVHILEEKVAALEQGCTAVAFASGMAATSAAILAVCKAGSHIICMRDVYGPVKGILNGYFIPKMNMTVSYWDGRDLGELEGLICDETDMILLESPATFVFCAVDIRGVAKIAKEHGIRTYIDNTYCTPIYQKPLTMGIDIVMHTMSKYIGGHSDIIGGILAVKDEELGNVLKGNIRAWFGGIIGPMEAWLAIRGLRTLNLRVERHQQTAMAVAEFLESHPKVTRVFYSGLASHPQAELIGTQQTGHTGLLSFIVKGTAEQAKNLVDSLKVFEIGCSWGGFESLALCPLYAASGEELDFLGLGEEGRSMIRIHCGLEGADVLIEDLKQAFERI